MADSNETLAGKSTWKNLRLQISDFRLNYRRDAMVGHSAG
jgi:hypothetical protein